MKSIFTKKYKNVHVKYFILKNASQKLCGVGITMLI